MAGPEADAVRVTFVSSHAKNGGAEGYLETVLRELGPAWVRGVVSLEDGPFNERLAPLGAPLEVIHTTGEWGSMLRSTRGLRRALRARRPDVVHANGIKAALMAAMAVRGLGIPLLWVKHDFSWDGPLARAVAAGSTRVVAVSEALVETFGPRQRRKVSVVHNGLPPLEVDRGTSRARLPEDLGAMEPAFVVALVGRLHPVKGHLELLSVAADLRDRIEGFRVAFVGGEDPSTLPHAARVRAGVEEFGLGGVVSFLGHRDDATTLIAGADVLAVASVRDERGMGREGFPLVGLEGMAAGTPVVAYADGGLPEMLGHCGFLVPPGNRTALRDAIERLATDRELWNELSSCGRDRVTTTFSIAAMIEPMKRHYREVAATGRQRGR